MGDMLIFKTQIKIIALLSRFFYFFVNFKFAHELIEVTFDINDIENHAEQNKKHSTNHTR